MPKKSTSARIIMIAHELLSSGGLGAVSFDAIARRLGASKQAVLYWFPTKSDLLAAMFVPWLEAEAESAVRAVADARDRTEAIECFVRAVAQFHFDDLNRFRMMYLVPQTTRRRSNDRASDAAVKKIHPVTSRLYSALADRLERNNDAARAEAFAIHSAVLGIVLMVGLADAVHDPLKHREKDLIDTLIRSLTAI